MKKSNFEEKISLVFANKLGYKLYDAMNYSLVSSGKRFRPNLIFTVADVLGIDSEVMEEVAIAIELIHTYSLIHDDLPCLDDDSLRRGVATNHVVYGEDYALLAGDNLQSVAFEYIYKALDNGFDIKLLKFFARACSRMVEGQSLDIDENFKTNVSKLEQVHRLKTGALIEFCMVAPLFYIKDYSKFDQLLNVGENIGLAFQIRDDILDVLYDSEQLGKSSSDIDNNKITYPSFLGVDASCEKLEQILDDTIKILMSIECYSEDFENLIKYCRNRNR
ncbi:MAG: polyprenyl synthetase family protein [Bacilli bacterium]